MKMKIEIPRITEEEQTPLVKQLLEIIKQHKPSLPVFSRKACRNASAKMRTSTGENRVVNSREKTRAYGSLMLGICVPRFIEKLRTEEK